MTGGETGEPCDGAPFAVVSFGHGSGGESATFEYFVVKGITIFDEELCKVTVGPETKSFSVSILPFDFSV